MKLLLITILLKLGILPNTHPLQEVPTGTDLHALCPSISFLHAPGLCQWDISDGPLPMDPSSPSYPPAPHQIPTHSLYP